MPLFNSREAAKASALAELAVSNPFLPRRIELERNVLGSAVVGGHSVMHRLSGLTLEEAFSHLPSLGAEAEKLVTTARKRLAEGRDASDPELALYQEVSLYWLYNKYAIDLDATSPLDAMVSPGLWDEFHEDFRFFLNIPGRHFEREVDPAHFLAIFVQIWRAFRSIFDYIVGSSMPVTRLRAAVWQSIFTHDLRRYATTLYAALTSVPTLITGPSGTGKELVAKAIALSRYVPFNPRTRHFEPTGEPLYTVNLSALAPTLVESELFGHVKGAFTGAVRDRKGWLEECGRLGTVFLDEIGDVDPAIQVKLLRVIQERRFQRLGETRDRPFHAKIIAATNRDLAAEMQQGRFREDLYYRLCGDVVTTPSLREQLEDSPEDLRSLVRFIVAQQLLVQSDAERDGMTDEVVSLIGEKLPPDYPWPGNFRELEQCARNVLIHQDYRPPVTRPVGAGQHAADDFAARVMACRFSSDDLLRHYYTLVYRNTGSYKAAAEVLGIDWRTVRDKVDPELLKEFLLSDSRHGRGQPREL